MTRPAMSLCEHAMPEDGNLVRMPREHRADGSPFVGLPSMVVKVAVKVNDVGLDVLVSGAVLALLPTLCLFLVAQRYFVQGIAISGIKG